MRTTSIKLLLVANIIFLCMSVVGLSSAYFGGVEEIAVSDEKTAKIEAFIENEQNIEKLREFSKVSLIAQDGAYEVADSSIDASHAAVRVFCFMFLFNVICLVFVLRKASNLPVEDGQ